MQPKVSQYTRTRTTIRLFTNFEGNKPDEGGPLKKIQLTLVQIDNYGPWTVTPQPKPEAELQILQAKLFADLEQEFASRGGLLFQTRVDNMLAISNGLDLDAHREIQKRVRESYPITLSMGIGVAETPYRAQELATHALQRIGGSRSPSRVGGLGGQALTSKDENWVQIAHMDVNHVTSMTDSEPIYDTHLLLQRVHLQLIQHLARHGALVFYTGGDNFMAPSNGIGRKELSSGFDKIRDELGVELKAGVGSGRNAETASKLAGEALQEIREGKAPDYVVFKNSQGYLDEVSDN